MDENIRIESKDIITELKKDFSRTLNTTFEKISDSVDNGEDKKPNITKSEEE